MLRHGARLLPGVLACLWLAGCGQSTSPSARSAPPSSAESPVGNTAAASANWRSAEHVRGVVDLTAPGPDGSIVVAARGRLQTLDAGSGLRGFAPRYSAPPGLEPYLVRSSGQSVRAAGCRFAAGSLYALRLRHGNGVTIVDRRGGVRRFAALPRRGLENGIAFDLTGRFGHRLLVTDVVAGRTTLAAIDCRGRVEVLTRNGPRVEGGIAVAPSRFGRFAGDLIAPDELSGNVYAFTPSGHFSVVADSGLPHGQDIGVESEGFVPARFADALVADRGTPGNPHPGDDAILRLSHRELLAAGVRTGDLLVVSEGGAATIDIACGRSCSARRIAGGPAIAHIEGHVVFSRAS
jgi:hypothetical protein